MTTDFGLEVTRLLPQLHPAVPERAGTLVRLVGMRLEARGIMAPIGSCCEISTRSGHVIDQRQALITTCHWSATGLPEHLGRADSRSPEFSDRS